MQGLKCSEEEAIEILEYDKCIDKGERMEYDLSPEQEKLAKKFANATEHKKPFVPKLDKRPRKENATKKGIISDLLDFLTTQGYDNPTIKNAEREIEFYVGDTSYSITLIQHRAKKSWFYTKNRKKIAVFCLFRPVLSYARTGISLFLSFWSFFVENFVQNR